MALFCGNHSCPDGRLGPRAACGIMFCRTLNVNRVAGLDANRDAGLDAIRDANWSAR